MSVASERLIMENKIYKKIRDFIEKHPSDWNTPIYGYSSFWINFKGPKKVKNDGYLSVKGHGYKKGKYGYFSFNEHIYRAQKALEREIPNGVVVHHHNANQLVICQDKEYHFLLHNRMEERGCSSLLWEFSDWKNSNLCKSEFRELNWKERAISA